MLFAWVFVVFFVVDNRMYCWPQRVSCDAAMVETNEERYSLIRKLATNKWLRRVKRTVYGNTPAYYEYNLSDHVTSITENESTNARPTTNLATNFKNTEEVITLPDSSGLSNMQLTSDDVSTGTITDNEYTTVRAFNVVVTWDAMNDIGTSIAGYSETPEVSDETNTQQWNNRLTTYAAPNKMRPTLSDYMANKVGKAINRYAQPVIFTVGVVGNTISMLVMFQRHNRQTSFGIYLGVLALSDTLVLCTATAFWLERIFSSSPLRDIHCRMHGYLVNSLQMNGFFLILSLTFDRLMAVRFPLNVVAWCNARRAKLVSGVILVVALVVNIPFCIYHHVKDKTVCVMGTPGSALSFVFPWITVVVGFVLPFVSLTSMNAVIIMAIRNRRRHMARYAPERPRDTAETIDMSESATGSNQDPTQNQMSESVTGSNQDPPQNQSRDTKPHPKPMTSRDRNAIVTLLLVSFTFLLLSTPHFVKVALFSMTNGTSTLSRQADYSLLFQVSRKLYFTNNACNFFLYCLSGTKFRNDVIGLFRGKVFTG